MVSDDVCGCGVPEIVLADVAMKRQLVGTAVADVWPQDWILVRLARQFRDHPAWRPEWTTMA
jgi:hypothetical protein